MKTWIDRPFYWMRERVRKSCLREERSAQKWFMDVGLSLRWFFGLEKFKRRDYGGSSHSASITTVTTTPTLFVLIQAKIQFTDFHLLMSPDLSYYSHTLWQCSSCWSGWFRKTIAHKTGFLYRWLQNLPDNAEQVKYRCTSKPLEFSVRSDAGIAVAVALGVRRNLRTKALAVGFFRSLSPSLLRADLPSPNAQ